MSLGRLFQLSSLLRSAVSATLRRNIGISAVVFNRAKDLDPVQKLFLDKIREYNTKSKSVSLLCVCVSRKRSYFFIYALWFILYRSAGGVVEAGPGYQKNMTEEINKLQRLYGSGDLTKFPDFKFAGQSVLGYFLF